MEIHWKTIHTWAERMAIPSLILTGSALNGQPMDLGQWEFTAQKNKGTIPIGMSP
ncbi:MAG: hypothetical protein NXH90_17440 [Flavobacteriaceae bacterium]|nr:hypothetical protein [Flavobacteriaceae bacterium]